MKLIKLESNKASFHTINFKDGINIIVGKQATPSNKNDGNTYNGVGKSFVIHLIHFCLGSNKVASFEKKLNDWTFILTFSIDKKEYTVRRNTSQQSKVNLDGQDIKLNDFREFLFDKCFRLTPVPKHITWNTLFPRYARRNRSSYISFDKPILKEQDYSKVLNNSYLLGLDINHVIQKKELRDLQNTTVETEKVLSKDSLFKQYFLGNNDSDIDADEVEDKITRLKQELSNFKVSSNYHDIESEANALSYKKKKLENRISIIHSNIKNIENSLDKKINVNSKKVFEVYESAKIEIPTMVKKSISEVLDFHNKMLINRDERLREELFIQNKHLHNSNEELSKLGLKMDALLIHLNSHGALEEYLSLADQVKILEGTQNRIHEYKQIFKKYQDKKREIKSSYIILDKEVSEYLEKKEEYINSQRKKFRDYCKEFYPKKSSGLSIVNNSNENTIRFDIDAKIEDDSSDGVNEVKIFCFDLLILTTRVSNINFLIHDSRLLANMDPRQRMKLFILANDVSKREKIQYICSANEDSLQSIQQLMIDDDYQNIIGENIILELNDDSPKSKLLGKQIDIDLE